MRVCVIVFELITQRRPPSSARRHFFHSFINHSTHLFFVFVATLPTMATNYVHDRYLDPEERYEVFTVKAAERPHLISWTPHDASSQKHVMHVDANDEVKNTSDACGDNHNPQSQLSPSEGDQLPPPLTDGCDLPGWRSQRIAPCMNNASNSIESVLEGTLNVGFGSTLYRRESQFPFICSDTALSVPRDATNTSTQHKQQSTIATDVSIWWHSAKQRLSSMQPPPERDAPVVHHSDVSVLVDYTSQETTRKVTLFSVKYEMTNRPVKILGATQGWEAMPCYEKDTEEDDEANPTVDSDTREDWADVGDKSSLFTAGGRGGWT
eukprot:scaffold376_cov199-Alexandrium_tamarense.AAC.12